VTPDWSHDGLEIAYVSTDVTSTDGHPDWTANAADIRVVPYGNRAGGTATLLPGASDPNWLEYYPAYSADDAFIAFTRAPRPSNPGRGSPGNQTGCVNPPGSLGENPDGPYYNRNGEIYVVTRGGGEPIRLRANDPVACTGETSRGVINSWPKWSPRVETDGETTYYFLLFSSARAHEGAFDIPTVATTPPVLNKSSQLYMAPLVVDAAGAVTTYPAVYLWNQNVVVDAAGTATVKPGSNLTPAWDDFSLPPVPPPVVIVR
jgi:hypothetical protein